MATKKVTYKKVEASYTPPFRIIWSSTGEVAEYDYNLPPSTHRKQMFYVYKFVSINPVMKNGRNIATLKTKPTLLTREDIDKLKRTITVTIIWDYPS